MTRLLLVLLLVAGCATPRPATSDVIPAATPPSISGRLLASGNLPSWQPGAPHPLAAGPTATLDLGSPLPAVAAVGEPAQRTAIPSAARLASKGGDAHGALVTFPDDKTAAGVRSPSVGPLSGVISHMGNSPVGPRYAAIPWGPGIRVRICAARCVTVVSADTGPSLAMQRAGRVADVSVELFVAICGRPASAGLCQGTVSR